MAIPFDEFLRNLDLAADHVAMDLDVTRALLLPDCLDHTMQLLCGRTRVGEHSGGAGYLVVDAMLRFNLARLVMDEGAQLALLFSGGPGEEERKKKSKAVRARRMSRRRDSPCCGRPRRKSHRRRRSCPSRARSRRRRNRRPARATS